MGKNVLLYLMGTIAVGGWVERVEGHALGCECKLVGERIAVECYYDDDTPARDALVKVEDRSKRLLAEGKTDAAGVWSFARPSAGVYVVIVDAGAGHRTQLNVTVPKTGDALVSARSEGDAAARKPAAAPGAVTISDGTGREEFTAFPWLKLGLGLTLIGGFGMVFWWVRRVPAGRMPTR